MLWSQWFPSAMQCYVLLNISCWIPVNGIWGMKTSTAGEYHTQLFPSCWSLFVWCLILSTLTNKDLQYQQFHVKKKKKEKEGSICSQTFSLSKCQTSQHVRHISEVFPIALGQTSVFKSENWKFDCEEPFNICCSWCSTGSAEGCLEINLGVLVYF